MGRAALKEEEIIRSYDEIKDDIQDGDIFMFRGEYLISKIFRKIDLSFYSHAAVTLDWPDRRMLMQAEMQGLQAVPLSVGIQTYNGRVDWYRLLKQTFTDPKANLDEVFHEAKSDLGMSYGIWPLIRNAWAGIWNIRLKDGLAHPNSMFCSQYVEHCFKAGNMSLSDKPTVATFPKQIAHSKHLKYMCTIPHDPNKKPRRDEDIVMKIKRIRAMPQPMS